jgi:hypothetical protein
MGIIINPYQVQAAADAIVTPPFDDYGSPSAGYSMRKLDSSYSGSAIRVREDSGNTEADIGFDSSGDLDINSPSGLLAHVGSNSGFIVKWYDQSGNSYDITQVTTTAQPKIVDSGSVVEINGKPAILYDGSTDFMVQTSSMGFNGSTAEVNQYSVQQMLSSDVTSIYIGGQNNVYYWVLQSGSSSTAIDSYCGPPTFYKNGTVISSPTRDSLFTAYNTDAQTLASLTGLNMQYFNTTPTTNFNISNALGGSSGWRMNAYIQELLFWRATDLPTQADVETNINDYYTIF